MNSTNLTDKVALVTGATSGIGLETAKALAHGGAELFLVVRNLEKGERIAKEIQIETGNQKIRLLHGNLSCLNEVHELAQRFLAFNRPLHILLNNAGTFNFKRKFTIDGLEEMFAVNHLSHFLLTNLLLERIKSNGCGRIINVASGAHMLVKEINFEDLNFDNEFKALKVYSHSKLANILFNTELAARLKGSHVTANTLDPGEVSTGLGLQNGVLGKFLYWVMKPFIQTPQKGAMTSIYLCTSTEVENVSGKYFRGVKEKRPKRWATNSETAKKLWDVSEKLVCKAIKMP